MDALPLTAVERTALALCTYINTNPNAKAMQTAFHRQVGTRWIRAAIGHRLRFSGLEHVVGLNPDRGVLLCANHRSFFDQYVLMTVLYEHAGWPRRCYFPVRANFFYEEWGGIVVNGVIGGFAMWPPIFRQRDSAHADLNKQALDEICEFIREPGTIVGMHPEGTRGKGPDPYALLHAQPGVGTVVMRARPIVLPVFINGLGNELLRELTSRFDAQSPSERPINCVFGAPVDFGELLEGKPRPAQYKRVADRILEAIRALGHIERGLREGNGKARWVPTDGG